MQVEDIPQDILQESDDDLLLSESEVLPESALPVPLQVQSSLRTKDTLGTGILSSFQRLSLSRRLAIV